MIDALGGIRPSEARLHRRRLGWLLVAYGASGLLLAALGLGLILASLGTIADLARSVDAQRREVVALFESTATTLDRIAIASDDASASLTRTAETARRASALTTELADAMAELSRSADVVVLGTRPFAPVAAAFARIGERARAVSTELDRTASSVDRDAASLARIAGDVRAVRIQIGRLADGLGESGAGDSSGEPLAFAVSRLVLVGLLLWLAVPAAVSLWLGARLVRGSPPPDGT
jgi:hypothetical protein